MGMEIYFPWESRDFVSVVGDSWGQTASEVRRAETFKAKSNDKLRSGGSPKRTWQQTNTTCAGDTEMLKGQGIFRAKPCRNRTDL